MIGAFRGPRADVRGEEAEMPSRPREMEVIVRLRSNGRDAVR
jgi:hypothetical protein